MKIIQTCTTKAKTNTVPLYELLIWITSIITYKQLGYTLKLYCSKDDIPYLKNNFIYDLYDEIDSDFFDNNEKLSKVNMNKFWSTRKIEALYNELINLNENVIYSDTDIIMKSPFELNRDALFWTEEIDTNTYPDWRTLSTPNNYVFLKEVLDCDSAYNGGIIWIKDKNVFKTYYDEYYKFVIDNPCITTVLDNFNNLFACNAEQRILKGVLDKLNIGVDLICPWESGGIWPTGIHLFVYKAIMKQYKTYNENLFKKLDISKDDYDYSMDIIRNKFENLKNTCLTIIKQYDKNIYNYLMTFEYIQNKFVEYL